VPEKNKRIRNNTPMEPSIAGRLYLGHPKDGFNVKLSIALIFSTMIHLFTAAAILFAPSTVHLPKNNVIMTELIDFPKGPGLGPELPNEQLVAVQKPTPVEKIKKEPEPKPNEMRLPDRVKEKNRIRTKDVRQMNDAIERIRQLQNAKSSGGGGTSDQAGGSGIYGVYIKNIKNRIKKVWVPPGNLTPEEKKKSLNILIKISSSGQVLTKQILNSWGNQTLDRSALNAIEKSFPAPPPPPIMAEILASEGIEVAFKPREKDNR